MPISKKIRVMISSRCNDQIDYQGTQQDLSEVRKQLQIEINDFQLFGNTAFDCWINEGPDTPPAPGSETSWEHCLNQVNDSNILIVLYNGNAGWCKSSGGIGICHAELAKGMNTGAAKVYLIKLPTIPPPADPIEQQRNKDFKDYLDRKDLFRGGLTASTGEEVIEIAKNTLREATIDMVKLGVREARKGKYDTGDALDWTRLSFIDRKTEIEKILSICIGGTQPDPNDLRNKVININTNNKVLVRCHGIPAAMTISAARELVGQPFLKDHELADQLGRFINGPVHLIGCHRNVTENQALNVLGFPDATVVDTIFGIYIADNIQKIQLVFLSNCRDVTSTKHAVQRFLDWLDSSGEAQFLVDRAKSRKAIVKAIKKEI